ncbi:membrane fusion protein of efflux pump [Bacteroidales bacterium]|nr:membrane fusion protein of efflux pump [Bacteroidales bacterium]
MKQILIFLICASILGSCKNKQFESYASGTFEATEVIVSAESAGKIEAFKITEGDLLAENQEVGYIDSTQLYLKKRQLIQTKHSIDVRLPNVNLQIAATKEQLEKALLEKKRIAQLLKENAATQKQMDDINSQVKVLESSLLAMQSSLSISVNSINAESANIDIQIAQMEDQLAKCRIVNPIEGRVLSKYAQEKEMAVAGRALYKIADTQHLFLRAYLVSIQLDKLKLGQEVEVFIQHADAEPKIHAGKIAWISDKAEFTPKTIQTKDERQNLVYAIKVAVENTEGLIKIGMYGDLKIP